MPELPEVETVRRALHLHLAGKIIRRARHGRKRLRRPWPKNLAARLEGLQVTKLTRRGKFILAELDRAGHLLIHLGMSGRFILSPAAKTRNIHLRLWLADGAVLAYCDPRRFGVIDFLPPGAQDKALARLGLEPFSTKLTPAFLQHHWRKSRRTIKSLLLAQSPIAGIGNIYACEALFAARLSPFAPAARLSRADFARLIAALQRILRRAIAAGGATLRDHRTPTGLTGRFQFAFQVYDRAGASCRCCCQPVMRKMLSGRSVFFCPRCQPPDGTPMEPLARKAAGAL